MKTFELIVDEKVAVWRRSTIEVEAKSREEAINKCLQYGTGYASRIIDSEYLYETEELSSDGPITVEVMDLNYNVLASDDISGK